MTQRSTRPGHRRRSAALAIVATGLAAALLTSGPVAAVPSTALQVKVESGLIATFDEGGAALWIRVAGRCTLGAHALEAFVYITQDGYSTESGTIPLRCFGYMRRWVVLVPLADVVLHRGPAAATAYALVEDPGTGETADDNSFKDIIILP